MTLIYILFIVIIAILMIIIKYYIYDERTNIAILKTLGFNTFMIMIIITIRFLLIFSISYIIGVIIYSIIMCTLGIFDFSTLNSFFGFSYYDLYNLLKCFLLMMILLTLAMISFYFKTKKILSIILFKN